MIKLTNIKKQFHGKAILRGIDIGIQKGDVVSLIGPSGTGKTTLLRCLNYLAQPDEGQIEFDDRVIDFKHITKKDILLTRKKTAMVFQNFNLFKNKTALENITEGLIVVRKKSRQEAQEIARHFLDEVGLSDKENSYPSQLSGGQQQRIAIARAVALDPEIILLDEPTSALDPELSGDVLNTIRKLAQSGTTMLLVTHDIHFARNISNRMVFMDEGVIVEEGSPEEIISSPKHERTQKFLSNYNRDYAFSI